MKLLKYKIYCNTEQKYHYIWQDDTQAAPTKCPIDTSHSVNLNSVSIDEVVESGKVEVTSMPAMASKTLGTKKLFKRVVGIEATLVEGSNEIIWACSFPWVKFMALELSNCEALDKISLYVLDTTTGTMTGFPNVVLNQFGFNVLTPKDFYKHESEFDADLYAGLQIKIVYNSKSNKNIGINFVMNEVK